ncbi:MAG: diguanylate cyclase [Planctomycetota bacterium]|jgi:two-component system cell cycle response regulator
MASEGNILLIDDDPDALRLLALLLERNHYTALTASDGEEALALIHAHQDQIDVVILDLMMPGEVDGYDVCRKMQELNSTTREIPVIILSAMSSPKDMARSFMTGAFQHITKPYDIHYLLAVVSSMIRMKRVQDNARATADKFSAIFENSPIGAMVIDTEYRVLEMSRALREVFPNFRLIENKTLFEIFYDPAPETPLNETPVVMALRDGTIHSAVLPVTRGDETNWWDMSASPLIDQDGHITGAVVTAADVTAAREMEEKIRVEHSRANAAMERYKEVLNHQDEITNRLIQTQRDLKEKTAQLEEANALLEKLSTTDELTSLPNRRFFNEAYEAEVRRSIRYNHALSVMMLDIDHFKSVNDTHGHPVGDLVLKELAKIFIDQLRETDIIGRYGGEEFSIVLPETTHQTAFMIADRLRERVSKEIFDPNGLALKITLSIGIACGFDDFEADNLLKEADVALYEAKKTGRNKVVLSK